MTGPMGRRGRAGSRIGAARMAALLVAGMFLVGTTLAGTPAAATPPAETATVPVMVILDASGSMNQSDAPGPRIDAAKSAVSYAITGYQTSGIPVTGADQLSEQAPLLNPGQFLDSLAVGGTDKLDERQGTTKYYTVPMVEGSTLHVSATLAPPARAASSDLWDYNALGVRLNLRAKDNYSCDSASDSAIANGGRQATSTTVMTTEVGGSSWSKRCPVEGVGILEVQRTGAAYPGEALPVEIVVRIEPAADLAGVPGPADKAEALALLPHGDQHLAITGGTSFNDAPDLASGLTYTDTLQTGGNRYYRIPLEWGQRLNYTVTEIGPAAPEIDTAAITWVDVYNPVRQDIVMSDWTQTGPTYRPGAADTSTSGSGSTTTASTTRSEPTTTPSSTVTTAPADQSSEPNGGSGGLLIVGGGVAVVVAAVAGTLWWVRRQRRSRLPSAHSGSAES